MKFTTDEQALIGNKLWRLENLYKIEDLEEGKLTNFTLKKEQMELFVEWEEAKRTSNRARIQWVILKARQLGISTFFLIAMLDDVMFNKNYHAGIIAHKRSDVAKLFKKVQVAFEGSPLYPKVCHDIRTLNATELSFRSTGSSISVSLSYRGSTLNHLHVSEFGKMSKDFPIRAQEVITGAFPSVVQNGGIISIESTADGVGGAFHELWSDAPGNGFNPIFFPWFNDSKYEIEPIPVPDEFRDIQRKYNLSDRKISWYYSKSKDLKDLLYQEFPCSADDAFLQSGRPVFKSVDIGRCHVSGPRSNGSYGAGIDTATGSGLDYSVLTIIDKQSGEQVFTLRSKDPIAVFAKQAVDALYLYNEALLNIELNGVGVAMKQEIDRNGYTNFYKEKRGYETSSMTYTNREGTVTSKKSKFGMVEDVKEAFRVGYLKISNQKTFDELVAYQYDDNNRMSAPPGSNDDSVMALLLAYKCLDDVQIRKSETAERVAKQKKRIRNMTTAEKIRKGIY